jgi:hypothetical protein
MTMHFGSPYYILYVFYIEVQARAPLVSLKAKEKQKSKKVCHLRGFKFTVVRVRFNGFKILVKRQFPLVLKIKWMVTKANGCLTDNMTDWAELRALPTVTRAYY